MAGVGAGHASGCGRGGFKADESEGEERLGVPKEEASGLESEFHATTHHLHILRACPLTYLKIFNTQSCQKFLLGYGLWSQTTQVANTRSVRSPMALCVCQSLFRALVSSPAERGYCLYLPLASWGLNELICVNY